MFAKSVKTFAVFGDLWLVQLLQRMLRMFINSRLPVSAYKCKFIFLFWFTIKNFQHKILSCPAQVTQQKKKTKKKHENAFATRKIFVDISKGALADSLLSFSHPSRILLFVTILSIISP